MSARRPRVVTTDTRSTGAARSRAASFLRRRRQRPDESLRAFPLGADERFEAAGLGLAKRPGLQLRPSLRDRVGPGFGVVLWQQGGVGAQLLRMNREVAC